MIPRSTYSATSITTSSDILGDPAAVAMQRIDAETREAETSDAALARIVKALGELRPGWTDEAACRGSGLDFSNRKSSTNIRACLAVCGICPVRVPCLAFAVDVGDVVSIMGGTDPAARRGLIRDRRQQLAEQRRQQLEADNEGDTE